MLIDDNILIKKTDTVKIALKKLDKSAKKLLFVINDLNEFVGTVSDGDIRRYILKEGSLEKDIRGVFQEKPFFVRKDSYDIEYIKKILLENKIEILPIIDNSKKVIDAITWEEAFSDTEINLKEYEKLEIPVVVMAGGKGSRMEPFTSILPKPLIPIGDKSILELIIEEFKLFGIDKFYFILNYKSNMIKAYFEGIDKNYDLKYVMENNYLGTAGGIKLLQSDINDNFIVSNCDSIIKADYAEVFKNHLEKKASLTILSSMQYYKIPYGIVHFENEGSVTGITEKPEYTFHINTGVYIINKECLNYIPDDKYFDMTDLINELIAKNKIVITYPVNESDYIDIGQWKEYKSAVKKLC
jgi:dTDP-glucose pyrophosphorylase